MRVALTGASGIVGGFVRAALLRAGHRVTPLDRAHGWQLGQPAPLERHDALIHCAFAHAPGRYRGGEGDDPQGFVRANLDGTRSLFDQAADQGVGRILFLSSRAVHDGHPAGTRLADGLNPAPTSLYGEVKAQAEAHLAALRPHGIATCALRATGVYGPGPANKWRGLFADHIAGRPVEPRVATEVHADDLARALVLLLDHPAPPPSLNCSDLILDRHDLLALLDSRNPPPLRADRSSLRVPDCRGLMLAGWRPGGMALLRSTLPAMLDAAADL
ncbi:MAG: NAD-dependent epimerase/dehydratase family protein [Paracoccus sp. (in: a-proteobacteria)]|uniref:NAD-dependent epimerase/dehydratase family protein n=1 Tax=Paracoccus sp. TaxID=267 RepID=UPI002E8A97E2|nr:NAD(P)-dependent oxidoreductase [Pseudomonadota bacterium]